MSNNETSVKTEIKKLSIDSTLRVKPVEIVELDSVILNNLSTKCKYISIYDLTDYTIKYNGGGFCLIINNLEGYFDSGFLEIKFKDAEQEKLYNRVWDQVISDDNKEIIKISRKMRLNNDDLLPSRRKFIIHNITIVVKPIIKKDNAYYPQISLNNCTYER